MTEKVTPLTPNGKVVLEFLQKSEQKVWVGMDLGDKLQVKGIYPVLNSLIRRGYVDKAEPEIRDFTDKNGKVTQKPYITYKLTESGSQIDINTL